MGKIMYKGQEYGGSSGGGEMPSCYDGLTELLENEVLTADTTNNVLRGNFEGELKLGYIQDAYKIDENGDPVVWGDTEQTGLTGAIGSMCDRIEALEEGSGGGGEMPACYSELTEVLENGDLRFNVDPEHISMNLTGYHMRLDVSLGHIYDADNWGDTNESELDSAINSMCSRIADLEEGGGGSMPAEYSNLTTMLEDGDIVFNPTNDKIEISNSTDIDLGQTGDIIKSGYWAGSTGGGISDSGSLVTFMEALCTVVNTTGTDLDNLEDTVGGLSDTTDTLNNNLDNLSATLSGFTSGYITFEDSNNMTFSSIALHLDDSDIVNESGYWGAWEDEQTQENSDGTQTHNLAEALSDICRRLEAVEAVLQNQ